MGLFSFLNRKKRGSVEDLSVDLPPPPIPDFDLDSFEPPKQPVSKPDLIQPSKTATFKASSSKISEIPPIKFKPKEEKLLLNPFEDQDFSDFNSDFVDVKSDFRQGQKNTFVFEDENKFIPKKVETPKKVPGFALFEEPTINFDTFESKDFRKPDSDLSRPLFVKLELMRQVNDDLSELKKHMEASEESIFLIDSIETEKERGYLRWQSLLEDIQRKLIFIDKTIYKD